jgi:glycine/D-amino acid oxidase-like deaminating enzyme
MRLDGVEIEAASGESVAAALFAHGIVQLGTGADGGPRGAYCGSGICHGCAVTIDGRGGQLACQTQVVAGMDIRRPQSHRADLLELADLAALPGAELPVESFDVAVVGAGRAAMDAASQHAGAGLSVVALGDRPGSVVWGAFGAEAGARELAVLSDGVARRVVAKRIVIATGSYSLPPLVPGAHLPGVIAIEACTAMLDEHGVAPGRRTVFAGHDADLLVAAAALHRAGGTVAVVIVQAPEPPHMHGAALQLQAAGIPLLWGHALRRIEGEGRVARVIAAAIGEDGGLVAGEELAFDTDAVCINGIEAPSSDLARLLGCAHVLAPGHAIPHVVRGEDGSTSLPDVFVVGPDTRAAPAPLVTTRETVVCRCEGLSLGHLQDVAASQDVRDVATLKRLTRAGMGRCQGRLCAAHLPEVLGLTPAGERDLLAPQAPLRPIPLAAIAVEKPEWGGHRRSMLPDDRAGDGPALALTGAATVVVGAGVAGLSTAYFLARAGHDVLVIDAGRANAMASGANAGSLHVQLLSFDFGAKAEAGGSPAARTAPLQLASVALWRELEQAIGAAFELRITGGVMVAETETELRFLADKTAMERRMGIACEVITAGDLARLEPNLAPGLLGAAYCADEGKINPMLATQAILKAAIAAGACVCEDTSLRHIERTATGFLLRTNRGTLAAGRLVNAAGAFASRIGRMLGHEVPVFGAPLQMIVTEPVAPLVRGLVAHADRHLTLKQSSSGGLIIGGGWSATLDGVHQRPRPLRDSIEGNLWVAQRVIPALRRAHVVRSWAAMNVNIDGAPILGEHPAEPGFYNAVSSNGYTLGPMVGRVTADLILWGRTEIDISAFGIGRFEGRV